MDALSTLKFMLFPVFTRMNDVVFPETVIDQLEKFCVFGRVFLDLWGNIVAPSQHCK